MASLPLLTVIYPFAPLVQRPPNHVDTVAVEHPWHPAKARPKPKAKLRHRPSKSHKVVHPTAKPKRTSRN